MALQAELVLSVLLAFSDGSGENQMNHYLGLANGTGGGMYAQPRCGVGYLEEGSQAIDFPHKVPGQEVESYPDEAIVTPISLPPAQNNRDLPAF